MADLEIKKRGKNFIVYTNGMIKLERVRCSYPHLDKPYAGKDNGGDSEKSQANAKFGIVGMLPKATHVEAKNACVEAIAELLKANDNATVSSDKKFIRNGDDQDKPEYAGNWTVSAREGRQPGVRDVRGNLITDPKKIADLVYGGCYVNLLIRPWYQDGVKVGKGYGKRVNAGLMGVQFVSDGEPFGEGRIDDTGAWGDESSGAGDDGMDDDSDDGL